MGVVVPLIVLAVLMPIIEINRAGALSFELVRWSRRYGVASLVGSTVCEVK